jgi:hypothetical protein
MNYLILSLVAMPLAVWRLSNMLSDTSQSGLFDSLNWIRAKIGVKYDDKSEPYGDNTFAEGVLCIKCNSIWFGILFTILLICNQKVTFFVSLPFALSAITIWIEDWRNWNAS